MVFVGMGSANIECNKLIIERFFFFLPKKSLSRLDHSAARQREAFTFEQNTKSLCIIFVVSRSIEILIGENSLFLYSENRDTT